MHAKAVKIFKDKDIKKLHHPRFFNSEILSNFWLYEWLMSPKVYKNDLLKHIYTVNCNDNLFTQYNFITWNEETMSIFLKEGYLKFL